MSNDAEHTATLDADVVLVGGGIMSATLGAMIAVLQPDWRIVLLERSDAIASESSDPWNNAGTATLGSASSTTCLILAMVVKPRASRGSSRSAGSGGRIWLRLAC